MGSYNVKVAGTWRPAKEVHVNVAGTWRKAKEVWVKSGGVWRKAFVDAPARTVSIVLRETQTVSMGAGNQYQEFYFRINVSDGVVPTSRVWSGSGFSYEIPPEGIFETPVYNPSGFTYQANATIDCQVVVAGVTYNPSYNFTYTASDQV